MCNTFDEFTVQAIDSLTKLFQFDRPEEVKLINETLLSLLKLGPSKFFATFFAKFEESSEHVRVRSLQFVSAKLPTLDSEVLTKEVEEQIMELSKKAMEDVTKDEFIYFVGILTKLKLAKTLKGQSMIVESIKAQADLDKDIDVEDSEAVDKFLMCTVHSIPLLTLYNRSSAYVNYICSKILPNIHKLAKSHADLPILQALAELSPFIVAEDNPAVIDLEKCQRAVYDKLLEYLPLHQTSETQASTADQKPDESAASANADGDSKPDTTASSTTTTAAVSAIDQTAENKQVLSGEPDFHFTHIEYLLYALHQLCRIRPEFFSEELQNDSRMQLHHLSVGCNKYMELLSNSLKEVKSSEDLKIEENRIRNVALRTTKNISTMVKDLFKKPPQFKTGVLLSCKPLTARPVDTSTASKFNQNRNNDENPKNQSNPHKKVYNQSQNNSNNNHQGGGGGGQKNKYRNYFQHPGNNKRRRF